MSNTPEPVRDDIDIGGMRDYLARTDIDFALLFGSAARGRASDSSDVDVALRFPRSLDDHERFRRRNRIDAELQQYADTFVDVSDIDTLPIAVASAAVRNGRLIVGTEDAVTQYRKRVTRQYEATEKERKQERKAFIDRIARGDV
ncbi:type VII toxin-antitoxin system MntA family adenylyltransferase antitoxin [Halocatena pleomorpha]|uniref:Nucleotidyltransferase domain-containing protein n=1 Tax=Halocatena pleomorpha TaxID=1785090 RepID=A0A3P3RHZ7_9EURY|nr:nucleotidyltransferase domain-containing protein [Halocatena pleomorpha]RRJ33101.1 nucleotidyltransferase domain-containing protein [Halocatena pleomorpha]